MPDMKCTGEKCPIPELTKGATACTAHDCKHRTPPMPDIKEKLVELMVGAFDKCCSMLCYKECEYYNKDEKAVERNCQGRLFADHLISNGVPIQQWISVEERLPEPNRKVLVHYSSGLVEVGFWLSTSEHFTLERLHGEATHWMPLPEPPKGE